MAWNPTPDELEKVRDSFWSRVEKTDGCWLWRGAKQKSGYGFMTKRINGKHERVPAHRLALMFSGVLVRPWPLDLVLHSCDVPNCVNPSHLRVGNWKENAGDCLRRNRKPTPRGEANWFSRLTEQQVRDIRSRRALGVSQAQIAREFGIAQTTVSAIERGLIWKHVESPSCWAC